MARVLIVGCGCRGRALARALADQGHAVRGTTRRNESTASIGEAGAEPAIADPNRVGTLVGALEGVAVACWLMGSARGPAEALAALHGPRLRAFLERLVETGVRGVVYEAAGTVDPGVLAGGVEEVRRAEEVWRIPVGQLRQDPAEPAAWTAAATAAVTRLLEPPAGAAAAEGLR